MHTTPNNKESAAFGFYYRKLSSYIEEYTATTGISFESEKEAVITVIIDSAIHDFPRLLELSGAIGEMRSSFPLYASVIEDEVRQEISRLYFDPVDQSAAISALKKAKVI
jgi:hypothetical protein